MAAPAREPAQIVVNLTLACQRNDEDSIRMIRELKGDNDINDLVDDVGRTALEVAIQTKNDAVCAELIEMGIHLDRPNRLGNRAVDRVVHYYNHRHNDPLSNQRLLRIFGSLVRHGADVSGGYSDGGTTTSTLEKIRTTPELAEIYRGSPSERPYRELADGVYALPALQNVPTGVLRIMTEYANRPFPEGWKPPQ